MAFKYGYVPLEELLDWVRAHPLPDGRFVPVCMWGSRGIGKTQQLKGYTYDRDIGLRVLQPAHLTTGADLVGIPFIDPETRKTIYALPERLPKPDDEDVAKGGILFIDEINRANLEVLQGLMEVIGEGTIGQSGWELPHGWMVVAAANPNQAGYDVNSMDDAMVGRMLHYAPGFNTATWARWARETGLSSKVVDFVLQNPDLVDTGEARLPDEVRPTLNPRSGAYLAALYEDGMDRRILDVVATGLWGEDTAEAMLDHHQDPVAPLTGEQILASDWSQILETWIADKRLDLIRASGENLISLLQPQSARRCKAADRAARWMSAIPNSAFIEMVFSFEESAPSWLPVIFGYTEYRLSERLPRNRSMIRRPAAREIEQERLARSEQRRAAEIRETQEQLALPPARVADPATPVGTAQPAQAPLPAQPPGGASPDESRSASPSVAVPPSSGITPLRRDEADDDADDPFAIRDYGGFRLPDFEE